MPDYYSNYQDTPKGMWSYVYGFKDCKENSAPKIMKPVKKIRSSPKKHRVRKPLADKIIQPSNQTRLIFKEEAPPVERISTETKERVFDEFLKLFVEEEPTLKKSDI